MKIMFLEGRDFGEWLEGRTSEISRTGREADQEDGSKLLIRAKGPVDSLRSLQEVWVADYIESRLNIACGVKVQGTDVFTVRARGDERAI